MDKKNAEFLLDDQSWIQEVSDHFEDIYLPRWITEYRSGILTKTDIINVTEKVIKHTGRHDLLPMVMGMLGH